VHVVAEKGPRRITDFLVLEAALALWFWLPYPVAIAPGPVSATRLAGGGSVPLLGAAWFALWVASPYVALVGLLMVPRALRTPGGWVQVVTGSLLGASIWYQFTRVEVYSPGG
jgi:hypothetical protein